MSLRRHGHLPASIVYDRMIGWASTRSQASKKHANVPAADLKTETESQSLREACLIVSTANGQLYVVMVASKTCWILKEKTYIYIWTNGLLCTCSWGFYHMQRDKTALFCQENGWLRLAWWFESRWRHRLRHEQLSSTAGPGPEHDNIPRPCALDSFLTLVTEIDI